MGILRLILAISVVIAHSIAIFGFSFVGGQNAVQTFYIISGFYMSLILNEKYIKQNNSYKLFITNRFLRLFPIYWVVLLLTLLGSIALYLYSSGVNSGRLHIYSDYFNALSLWSYIYLVFSNIFLFGQDIVMFLGLDSVTGNLFLTNDFRNTTPQMHLFLFVPQAWTIGLELTFYLIAPFLVRRSFKVIAPIIGILFLLRLRLYDIGLDHDPWTYRFFPTELAFFLLGTISYKIYKRIQLMQFKTLYLDLLLTFTVVVSLFFTWIPMLNSYLYFVVIFTALPFIFYRTKDWYIDTYIGELSYPMYISHLFVLSMITALKVPQIGGLGLTLTVATILFSILLNKLITKKVEKIRQRRVIHTADNITPHLVLKTQG